MVSLFPSLSPSLSLPPLSPPSLPLYTEKFCNAALKVPLRSISSPCIDCLLSLAQRRCFARLFFAKISNHSHCIGDIKHLMLELCYFDSQAKHQNIVGVIGCLAIDNNLAIVMELVMGGNLKQFLKNDLHGAEKKEFTERFVKQIGSAIEHLHSLNIIHRDVKPDNILVSMRRRVRRKVSRAN